jgi:hypothetical protein
MKGRVSSFGMVVPLRGIAHRKDMMINEGDVYIPYKITRMHK